MRHIHPLKSPFPWIVLLIAIGLLCPSRSEAISAVLPNPVQNGGTRAITVQMEPHEFDAGGNWVSFFFWTEGIPTAYWALVPQFVDEATVFVSVPANFTGIAYAGRADCQGDPAQLTPGTNPFTCGGVAPFGVVPDDPGNPPPPANADILTGVQPQSLTRGHPMTLTLQFDAVSWPYKDVALQYQVAGAWTTQSIHHNAWDSASHDVFCSTSTTTCTVDVEIPGNADLGTAYLYNAYGPTNPPMVPVKIIGWPPVTLSSLTPDTMVGGGASVTVVLMGSGFQSPDLQVLTDQYVELAATVLSDTEMQVQIPAALLTVPGDLGLFLSAEPYDYRTASLPLHLVMAGGPIPGLTIDSLSPRKAFPGKCISMTATTTTQRSGWGPSPFLAYTYLAGTGVSNGEVVGPVGPVTATVPLSEGNFTAIDASDPATYQIDFELCLPPPAVPFVTGLVAPGGLVDGQPSAWVYPGLTYDIRSLFNTNQLAFTAILPNELRRGSTVSISATTTPDTVMDGADVIGEFHYTVAGAAQTRSVPVHCGGTCTAEVHLPANADLGPGYLINPDAVENFPGVMAPFTIIDGMKIVSITPSTVAVGSPDTTVTLSVSGYEPATTDLWLYEPRSDTWFLVGTDTGSFTVIDGNTVSLTIPASLLVAPTTLTVELDNNDTGDFVDQALPVEQTGSTASLILGDLQQSGTQVLAPIAWTSPVGGTVDCGTTPAQTSSADTVSCAYDAPGTYQVTGVYGDHRTAEPLTVVIPRLTLTAESLVTKVWGAQVEIFTTYSSPVPVDLAATFTLASGIGIPDALDTGASSVAIARAEGGTSSASFTSQDGLAYGGRVYLQPGTYILSLVGQSRLGLALSASTTLTITQVTAELSTEPLAQAGASVQLPVAWPSDSSLTNQEVDCGTGTQGFTGTSGTCTYSRVGSYIVKGRFTDALGTSGIPTAPVTITVPPVAPGPAVLRAAPVSGNTPTHDLSDAVPVATYGTPTVYPVPVAFSLTFDPPTGGQVGIPDRLDVTRSKLYVKPVASAADLTAPISGTDQVLGLQGSGDGTYSSTMGLSTFVVNSTDPSTWEHRILLRGRPSQDPVTAELRLQGSRGDASQITYTQQRIAPIYPYVPTNTAT